MIYTNKIITSSYPSLILSGYPRTFINNPIIKEIEHKVDERLKDDKIAQRVAIRNIYDLVYYVEDYTKDLGIYEIIYPYFRWIYSKYGSKKIKDITEISDVITQLVRFQKYKQRNILPNKYKDINQIKDSNHLRQIIGDVQGPDTVFSNSKLLVVRPTDWESMRSIGGRNKNWDNDKPCKLCVVGSKHYFTGYFRYGQVYIIFLKPDKRRIYYHYPNVDSTIYTKIEIKDISNFEIKPDVIEKIIKKYPDLKKVFKGKIGFDPNPPEKHVVKMYDLNPENLTYYRNPSESLQLHVVRDYGLNISMFDNPTQKVKEEAVKQNPNAIQVFVLKGWSIDYSIMKEVISNRPTMIRLFIDKKIPEKVQLLTIYSFYKLRSEYLIKLIDDQLVDTYLQDNLDNIDKEFIQKHPSLILMKNLTPKAIELYKKLFKV